jgi:undecaprenyl-diphosphatase
MILVEKNYGKSERTGMEKISLKNALFIGAAQALALIPGVSRSGITIIAGLTRGMHRADAARFSFLLGTPVVGGATLLEAKNIMNSGDFKLDIFIAGISVSAIVGYIVIKYLMIFLQKYSLRPFAYYRFLLAFVIIISILISK